MFYRQNKLYNIFNQNTNIVLNYKLLYEAISSLNIKNKIDFKNLNVNWNQIKFYNIKSKVYLSQI